MIAQLLSDLCRDNGEKYACKPNGAIGKNYYSCNCIAAFYNDYGYYDRNA